MGAEDFVSDPATLSPRRRPRRAGFATSGGLPCAIRIAAFSSPDLVGLGRRLGFPLAVIAATTDPDAHLSRLIRRQHACWCLGEDRAFSFGGAEIDPFDPSYEQLRFDPRWMGRRRLPNGVAIESGSLLVALPHPRARTLFETELKSLLTPRRFDVFGARPGWVLRRRAMGQPSAVVPRYSCDWRTGSGGTAFTVVHDLYAFRPKQLPALAAAVVAARDRANAVADLAVLIRDIVGT